MTKNNKQKHKAGLPKFESFTSSAIVRRARTFPMFACFISSNWQKSEMDLIQVVIARTQPDGALCVGSYLIDKLCLGAKNTLAKADVSRSSFETNILGSMFRAGLPEECPPELAHQMIYGSIEYAARFGFEPQKDFEISQYLLAPRGELAEPYKLTFGKKGRPVFIAGPYDDVDAIVAQLERTAGPGKFDYVAPMDVL
ncbi:MAG: hypothetical protein PVSMB5_27830 [Ktedonobacteraceae bacterium]